jgi:hypothetical protein
MAFLKKHKRYKLEYLSTALIVQIYVFLSLYV